MTTIEKRTYSYEFNWGSVNMTEWTTWEGNCIISSHSKTKHVYNNGKTEMVYDAWDSKAKSFIVHFCVNNNGQKINLLR